MERARSGGDETATPQPPPPGRGTHRGWATAACVLIAYACLRLVLVRTIAINSDEPQHAHVAWAWSQGLVPYRDVFDNHVPLFHMLYAPVFWFLGETPDILTWLRVAIIPISVLSLGLAFWIARALWDRRVAVWAALFVAACPPYLYVAGQFRTDVLWGAAWIAVIAVAVLGEWKRGRAFATGVAIGIAFAISLKTLLLVAALGLAWAMVHANSTGASRSGRAQVGTDALLILLGALIAPSLVVALVAAKGGLAAMRYDVLQHNLLPGLGQSGYSPLRLAWMTALAALLVVVLLQQRRSAPSPVQSRRALVVASVALYGLLLLATWPLITRQDDLPAVPLLAIGVAGWWNQVALRNRAWVPPLLALVGVAGVLAQHAPSRDRTARFRATLADVLAVTSGQEDVLDDKGASIYRRRPFYYALETITLERLRRGLIADDIAQRLVDTDTHLVWANRLPARDKAFVTRHYLPLADGVDVAGFALGPLQAGESRPVQVLLPGAYTVLAGGHPSRGSFDHGVDSGTHELRAGIHTLQVARTGNYLLVWQPAAALFEAAKPL